MSKDRLVFADFEDPNRCSLCREPITAEDTKNGLVLHAKIQPVWALHPDTGKRLGMVQPDGPKNRYLHARPCAESYARKKLVCTACGFWIHSTRGSGLCLCLCHPPKRAAECKFFDADLERARGN